LLFVKKPCTTTTPTTRNSGVMSSCRYWWFVVLGSRRDIASYRWNPLAVHFRLFSLAAVGERRQYTSPPWVTSVIIVCPLHFSVQYWWILRAIMCRLLLRTSVEYRQEETGASFQSLPTRFFKSQDQLTRHPVQAVFPRGSVKEVACNWMRTSTEEQAAWSHADDRFSGSMWTILGDIWNGGRFEFGRYKFYYVEYVYYTRRSEHARKSW
jgi:hypothetical protein